MHGEKKKDLHEEGLDSRYLGTSIPVSARIAHIIRVAKHVKISREE